MSAHSIQNQKSEKMEDSQGSNLAGAPATKRKSSVSKLTIILGLGICLAVVTFIVSLQPFFKYRSERDIISATLKDPDSAKFSNEKVDSTGQYCGEVNSKNSYGGFTGSQRVILLAPCQSAVSILFQDGSYHSGESEKRVSYGDKTTDDVVCRSEAYTAGLDLENEALTARIVAWRRAKTDGEPPPLSEFKKQIFNARWVKSCEY